MYRYKCISIVDRYKSTTLINICQKMCFMFSQAMKRVLSRGYVWVYSTKIYMFWGPKYTFEFCCLGFIFQVYLTCPPCWNLSNVFRCILRPSVPDTFEIFAHVCNRFYTGSHPKIALHIIIIACLPIWALYNPHCAPCNTFGEQREIYEWIGFFLGPPENKTVKFAFCTLKRNV